MARKISAVLTLKDRFSNNMKRAANSMNEFRRNLKHIENQSNTFRVRTVANITAIGAGLSSLNAATAPVIAGVGALASSFATAGVGAVAFGAVATSVLSNLFKSSQEVAKLEEKIANADTAKERLEAQRELASLYDGMSESQKGALKNLQSFKSFWGGFVKQFENPIHKAFGTGLEILQKTFSRLAPTITNVSGVVNELLDGLNNSFGSSGATKFFSWLENTAAQSFKSLSLVGGNLLGGLFNMLQAFQPLATSMENGLVAMTQRFKEWGASLDSSKGFQNFIEYAKTNGPVLLELIGNVGGIFKNLIKDLAPIGTTVLAGLKGVTGIIQNNWPLIRETVIGLGIAVGTFAVTMKGLQIISVITTLFKAWRAGTLAQTLATYGLNTALLANPITWVVAGIAALIGIGVLLYRNWDTVKAKATELWTTTKEKFTSIKENITAAIQPVVDLFTSLGDKWSNFKNSISNFKMPKIGLPKWMGGNGLIQGSYAVGTNQVPKNMIAQIHKDEMIIPARQSRILRQNGVTIDNITNIPNQVTATNVANRQNSVTVNIYPQATNAREFLNEIIPELKLALQNM